MAEQALRRLSEHVYCFSPDFKRLRAALGAVVGERGTLLIESGNSPTHLNDFLAALSSHTAVNPRYIALTHWHWDHSFGSCALPVPVITHEATAAMLAIQAGYVWSNEAVAERIADGLEKAVNRDFMKMAIPDWERFEVVVPDVTFTDGLTIDLGDVRCELSHIGGDHALDSCALYIPEEKVLFLGDSLYPEYLEPHWRYTTRALFPLLDRVLHFDAELYIKGHDNGTSSRSEIELLAGALRGVGGLIDSGERDREALLAHWARLTAPKPTVGQGTLIVDAFLEGASQPTSLLKKSQSTR